MRPDTSGAATFRNDLVLILEIRWWHVGIFQFLGVSLLSNPNLFLSFILSFFLSWIMIELFPALGGLFLMVLGWVDRSRFFPMMTVAQFPWRPPSPWRPTSEWRTLPHLGHNMGGGFFSFSLAKSWDLWPNTSSSTCQLTPAKKRRRETEKRNGEGRNLRRPWATTTRSRPPFSEAFEWRRSGE